MGLDDQVSSGFFHIDPFFTPQLIFARTTSVPVTRWNCTWATKKKEVRQMVRRFHRSIYDELDELRASMDYLYQIALEPTENRVLPGEEKTGIVCQYVHNPDVEVTEDDGEITVTLDTILGTKTSKISAGLVNDTTLAITCERDEEDPIEDNGNPARERRSFSLHHVVPLPGPVGIPGSTMSTKNGVLDIRLKKVQPVPVRLQ